ncbi:lipopolysaccharide assembly protein LapA domain-containing protein [Cypionkella sp.]|jgi:lipopolysaccharide assembly protein A|uniref:lipopolysaccharide assembly protein LapA domain-containing protein n=1 Tax=Cypionkella sp. TaxID=2811411 RepID=UPI00374FE3E4
MVRYFRYFVLALIAVLLATMALANRVPVLIKVMPDDLAAMLGRNFQIELPLFLVMFGGIVGGILIGFVWEWAREHKHRAAAKGATKQVSRLERELAAMRDATSLPQDDVLALLDKPKA